MFLSPGTEIRVEAAGNDVSYFLPVRPLGNLRFFGLVPIFFSILFMSFAVNCFGSAWLDIFRGQAGAGDWMLGIFSLPFIFGGLTPAMIGLLIFLGRSRVEWHSQRLAVVDYAGPFRWK